jgi:hypothetical protein
VFHPVWPAVIHKTGCQPLRDVQASIALAQQQATRVSGYVAAIELGHDLAPIQGCKRETGLGTLCHSRSRFLFGRNMVW